jgi:DNA repair protein SbcC/Rad50
LIDRIAIEGFQAHKKTVIEFHPGMNVVTGASDAGKSSVIRALLWVVQNRPTGDTVRNWNLDKDATVKVTVEMCGKLISKIRKGSKAWYNLNDKKYEAMGSDVPQEIEETFNLTDINIQSQHTPYFLINDSAGKVAERLNELVHLDIIDKLYRNINGKITESKRKVSESEELINELDSSIKTFQHLDKIADIISEIDGSISTMGDEESTIRKLQGLITTIANAEIDITQFSNTVGLSVRVSELEAAIKDYVAKETENQALANLITEVRTQEKKIETEKDWLTVEERSKELIEQIATWQKANADVVYLQELTDSLNYAIEMVENQAAALEDRKIDLKSLLKKTKICPLCYQKIRDDVIERIIE